MKLSTKKPQNAILNNVHVALSTSELSRELECLRPQILRFCDHYLHNTHDAEEACQDALFKAYQAYARFKGKSSLKTWVMKIASNVCASFYRSNSKFRNTLSEEDFQFVEHWEAESEESIDFNAMLQPLNNQEKNILSFHFVRDMQLTEIAHHLDLNKSTVKMCYYRALNKFKPELVAA